MRSSSRLLRVRAACCLRPILPLDRPQYSLCLIRSSDPCVCYFAPPIGAFASQQPEDEGTRLFNAAMAEGEGYRQYLGDLSRDQLRLVAPVLGVVQNLKKKSALLTDILEAIMQRKQPTDEVEEQPRAHKRARHLDIDLT